MVKSYCVRQKKQTECLPGSEEIKIAKNGRQMMVCTCAECGATKTRFVKGRQGLISDRIKTMAKGKKLKTKYAAKASKMSASEIENLKNKYNELAAQRKEIEKLLAVYETIIRPPKKNLTLPTSDILKWNPNLDKKYQNIVRKNIDARYEDIMSKLPKPKRTTRKNLTIPSDILKWNPNLDKKYQNIVRKNIDARYEDIISKLPKKRGRPPKTTTPSDILTFDPYEGNVRRAVANRRLEDEFKKLTDSF